MKKLNFMAISALLLTAYQMPVSAMSSAKITAIRIAYTLKNSPRLKTAAKIGAGLAVIGGGIIEEKKRIERSRAIEEANQSYTDSLNKAYAICHPKEMESLKAELKKIEQTNCWNCLMNKFCHSLDERFREGASVKEKRIAKTICNACLRKQVSDSSLLKSCENCDSSKKSKTEK